jgi:hypothetical protein
MKKILFSLFITMLLMACGNNSDHPTQTHQPQYTPQTQAAPAQQAPIIVQAAPQQSSGIAENIIAAGAGAMAMHMLSNNNRNANPASVVEHKTIINKTVIVSAPQSPALPAPVIQKSITPPATTNTSVAKVSQPVTPNYSGPKSYASVSTSTKRK